ncbi:hypothetical protein [Microbacterium sp.]|uniref:hypothetical protein n=1 Tax=Microbacterium sp. TaxID=51671 RepID=UPI00391B4953
MTPHRTPPLALALIVAAGGALTLALAGCTGIQDALSQETTAEFSDAADLEARWDTSVPWLPADATAIVTKTKPDSDIATVLLRSGSALDAATCTEVDRESAPTVNVPEGPDVYAASRVFACGDWSVAATDQGWYGWTPNSAGEKEQAAS